MDSIQESHESFKIKADSFLKKVVLYIAREIKVTKFSSTEQKNQIQLIFFKYTIRFKEVTCSDSVMRKNIYIFLTTIVFMVY